MEKKSKHCENCKMWTPDLGILCKDTDCKCHTLAEEKECKDCVEKNYPHGHCINCKKNTNLCKCSERQNGNWVPSPSSDSMEERFDGRYVFNELLCCNGDYCGSSCAKSKGLDIKSFIKAEKALTEQATKGRIREEIANCEMVRDDKGGDYFKVPKSLLRSLSSNNQTND